MTESFVQLDQLPSQTIATIKKIDGGFGILKKLQVMGIRVGQKITINSKQPFHGPITIGIKGRELTIGRGMAKKILVEVIA
ncbi:MAG: FeoA family protein [Candidatus Thermoplasmatota archaeon]|nr:FeoA family protein [Candidatus Thermoplasmatota archaeon]